MKVVTETSEIKCTNICIIGVSEGKRLRNIFEYITAEGEQPSGSWRGVLYRSNPKGNTLRHIVTKMTKFKSREY